MTSVTRLPSRAVLEVTGEDRVPFLQGLVSNDVTEARPGAAVWAAMLTPQGKWLADFFITTDAERLLLDVEAAQAAMLAQRLTRYRLRAKVAIAPCTLAVHAGWNGPSLPGATPRATPDPRLPEAGWRLLTCSPVSDTATPEAYDRHRLSLGLPDGSRDMEAEKTTLLEAGFDELHGVSWTKGCYMGQELTARTKYRALLKRRFVPVLVEGLLPPPGTPILSGDQDVGTIRSGQGDRAIALLRLDAMDRPGLRCGGATLTPTRPTWLHMELLRLADAPA